jgi:hypothetical protein
MHDRFRCGLLAVAAASESIQPEAENSETPAAVRRNQSRRVNIRHPPGFCVNRIGQPAGLLETGRRPWNAINDL